MKKSTKKEEARKDRLLVLFSVITIVLSISFVLAQATSEELDSIDNLIFFLIGFFLLLIIFLLLFFLFRELALRRR